MNTENYDVVIVRGTPRFRLNKKLIAADKVPADIKSQLLQEKADTEKVLVVAPAPDVNATFTTEQPTNLPVEKEDEPSDNPYIEAGAPEEYPAPKEIEGSDFTELELELIEKVKGLEEQVRELTDKETTNNLGEALLNQLGVYTALAPRDPQVGDIHPFTLKPMNRYDTGLAYVERKKSVGVQLEKPVEVALPQPNPVDNGGFKSFDQRTGVSFGAQSSTSINTHANDQISEEATAEPNLRGTTIRPYW